LKNEKDELISGAELAKRLNVSPAYISKQKKFLISSRCTRGKSFYFIKSALALNKNPYEVQVTSQSQIQKEVSKQKKEIKEKIIVPKVEKEKPTKEQKPIIETPIKETPPPKEKIVIEDLNDEDKIRTLKHQIEEAMLDETNTTNSLFLNGLKTKASILAEYQKAINEEIKNKKLTESLFSKDEVISILTHLASALRSSLLNLPNNYAVNLEGLNQKQIKDYVTDDINKILEQIQNSGNQFE